MTDKSRESGVISSDGEQTLVRSFHIRETVKKTVSIGISMLI